MTDARIAKARAVWLSAQEERVRRSLTQCESPIEELLLWAFLNHQGTCIFQPGDLWARAQAGRVLGSSATCLLHFGQVVLGQQVCVLKFRVDFALIHVRSLVTEGMPRVLSRVAVEVDGHDFHERTKQQARRDKSRDRALVAEGWRVLRFTGSEVYEDAERCADEAIALIHDLHTREEA